MRKSAPGSWKPRLSSGGWESTSSQAGSTRDTDPRSDPTVLHTSAKGLHRNPPAISHDVGTGGLGQAWHQDTVVQGLWLPAVTMSPLSHFHGLSHVGWTLLLG